MSVREAGTSDALGVSNASRRDQSIRELDRVQRTFDAWFKLRTERDKDLFGQYAGLHKTRLETLQAVLQQGVASLKEELGRVAVDATRDRAQVYAECRAIDHATVWIQRVWLFYRDKFDQREDLTLRPLLMAADEVTWSCYRQIFTNKNNFPARITQGPAPLVYIDAQYSPATWEVTKQAPSELREASQIEGLESFLQTLPVPVLRLPTWCISAPWFLVFIGHEVGHNIQRELDLTVAVRSLITQACQERQAAGETPKADRWAAWGEEIFADLFSVAMMGPWAVRGLREILIGPAAEMTAPQVGYPLPVVRLALIARAADRFSMDGHLALGGLDLDAIAQTSPIAQADMRMVEPIVDKLLGPLSDEVTTLEKLCGLPEFKTELEALTRHWGEQLQGTPAAPTRSLQAARYITCGAWQAYDDSLRYPTTGTKALDALAGTTIDTLSKSGPPGDRAEPPKPTDVQAHGAHLAQFCLAAARQLPIPSEAAS
jgi:hypothetical protein